MSRYPLAEAAVDSKTRSRYLACVRMFVRWCDENGYVVTTSVVSLDYALWRIICTGNMVVLLAIELLDLGDRRWSTLSTGFTCSSQGCADVCYSPLDVLRPVRSTAPLALLAPDVLALSLCGRVAAGSSREAGHGAGDAGYVRWPAPDFGVCVYPEETCVSPYRRKAGQRLLQGGHCDSACQDRPQPVGRAPHPRC